MAVNHKLVNWNAVSPSEKRGRFAFLCASVFVLEFGAPRGGAETSKNKNAKEKQRKPKKIKKSKNYLSTFPKNKFKKHQK